MFNWYRINRIGAAGVLASLLFGGIEIMVFLVDGVQRADLVSPIGLVAEYIASFFTPPPADFRVGTDRRLLTYQLVVGTHLVIVPLFAALLWMRTRMRRVTPTSNALLALQVALGVSGMSSLLYVLAAQLAIVLPVRSALKWLATQIVLLAAVVIYLTLFHGLGLRDGTIKLVWMYSFLGLIFQLIAFGVAWLGMQDHRTRLKLAASNARLLATQSMLSDTVRASERLRIARDLHDAVGHHLTALNLHLDLAMRQAAAGAPESLRTSRELAGSLLAEVRSVVSAERNDRIDLSSAITTLCKGVPEPALHFTFDPQLEIGSPVLAHTLFFCVQEALTNAVRHSGAAHMNIDLRREGGQLLLSVDDDGCGLRGSPEGNGLRGMRERVGQQGGTLTIGGTTGCSIRIALPLAGEAP